MSTNRIRDGAAYLAALNDGRRVFIDGKLVDNVTTNPAFQNAVASFARLYDMQAQEANRELMTVPWGEGRRVNRSWLLPRCHADLVLRRQAIERWSELHLGFLGRSPDHLATTLGGMMMGLDVIKSASFRRAEALAAYFEHCAKNDLFVSYVIRNPQADRSKGASEQTRDVVLHVESEDADGVTVSGAKMLGTSSIMSDELFVGSIEPLKPGEDRYALSFAVPLAVPGLTLLSRRSYEAAANSTFDYPLSSHFDENDAVVHFDRVRVPWSRVFVCGDVALAHAQWHATPAHVYQNYQSQIRLMVKLRFLAGLALRIAETNGVAAVPQVKTMLGRLAAEATMVEGLVIGMEVAGAMRGDYFVPSAPHLYAALSLTQEMVPRFMLMVRELAGGGVIMLPSSAADLAKPEIRSLIEATQVSPSTDALGRISIMKLAWDALGSEFASRHMQYEMFYGGATYVNLGNMARTFDWGRATALVEHGLSFGRDDLKR
ncbi:MAG: 4-hydroxyphenylacetate 3-hydroxylase N-terminal domain-containing protein [Hyphomicrobiaceae bacterium]